MPDEDSMPPFPNDFDRAIQNILLQRNLPDATRISNIDIARYIEDCPPNRKPSLAMIMKANYRLADAVNRGTVQVTNLYHCEKYLVFRLEDPIIYRRSVYFERVQENGRTVNGHT